MKNVVESSPRAHDSQKLARQDDSTEARIVKLVTDLGNTVLTKRAVGELHR